MTELIGDRLVVAGLTDAGCVRALNEDCFAIDKKAGLLLVADGMGGHDGGEVASSTVTDLVGRSLARAAVSPHLPRINAPRADDPDQDDDEPTLDDIPNPVYHMVRDAINAANTDVNRSNRARGYENGTGMGTTVVGLWLPNFSECPVVFHVGDSRLYLFRDGQLVQVTRDHSMYQQWLAMGKKGPRPAQNILLQAIGPSKNLTPDVRFYEMFKGDVVLLCSDGLYGMVGQEKISMVLGRVNGTNLDEVCQDLVALAKEGGGKDNITLIVGFFIK